MWRFLLARPSSTKQRQERRKVFPYFLDYYFNLQSSRFEVSKIKHRSDFSWHDMDGIVALGRAFNLKIGDSISERSIEVSREESLTLMWAVSLFFE